MDSATSPRWTARPDHDGPVWTGNPIVVRRVTDESRPKMTVRRIVKICLCVIGVLCMAVAGIGAFAHITDDVTVTILVMSAFFCGVLLWSMAIGDE